VLASFIGRSFFKFRTEPVVSKLRH